MSTFKKEFEHSGVKFCIEIKDRGQGIALYEVSIRSLNKITYEKVYEYIRQNQLEKELFYLERDAKEFVDNPPFQGTMEEKLVSKLGFKLIQ